MNQFLQKLGLILVVHTLIFAIIFSTAPLVAAFFGEDRLTLRQE